MLELREIGHRVGKDPALLFKGLHLTIPKGSLCAIVGPNAAGKSTLLRLLAGLEKPYQGSVRVTGMDLSRVEAKSRATLIGYLPQHTPLYHNLKVHEVVALGRIPHLSALGGMGSDDLVMVDRALQSVGVTHLRERTILNLSGGEQKRVLLARLLATQTPLMLLDEPTAGLDVGHALEFYGLLRSLCQDGRTIVVAMHELAWASRFADLAICLGPGAEAKAGPAEQVLSPAHLAKVFDVRVEEGSHGLHFFAPKRQSALQE